MTDIFIFLLILAGSLSGTRVWGQDVIGLTAYARGAVSGQYTGGDVRLLGRGADIYHKDIVTTGAASYAILNLHDKTQVSIRPDSVVSMDEYSEEQDKESTVMGLFKGGLRSVTGYLAERNPEAVKVKTRVGEIGLKGGKVDARLCEEGECRRKTGTIVAQRTARSTVGGRVAHRRGDLSATNKQGVVRDLAQGAQVTGGDTVETGSESYAVLAFVDGTRASLKAETQFYIEDYNYDRSDPSKSKATLSLVKGGLRTLTGSIADDSPQSFKVNTAVATIGIRGTGFDLVWLGACVAAAANCGLIAYAWEHSITAENNSGVFDIGLNRIARIRDLNSPPEFLATPPVFTVPRPDEEEIDEDELFKEDAEQTAGGTEGEGEDLPAGLYLACDSDCGVTLDGETVNLAGGETGFISFADGQFRRLESGDTLLSGDLYFSLIEEGRFEETTLYELIDNTVTGDSGLDCYVTGR